MAAIVACRSGKTSFPKYHFLLEWECLDCGSMHRTASSTHGTPRAGLPKNFTSPVVPA
jgi:hypothetical protein